MAIVALTQRNKIHPHKFTLWVAIGSIMMMFAGLTSAYVVKRNQPNWQTFDLPSAFWISTLAMIASSITMYLAVKAFKQRQIPSYRLMLAFTFVLGVAFMSLQIVGFNNLFHQGLTMQKSASYGFLWVIVGLHGLHVLGGVIALLVMVAKAFATTKKQYSAVPVEVMGTYWHFVDLLWLYLLVFLWLIR